MRDVVGLYLDPPDHALVLCVDEKSQIQALDRTAAAVADAARAGRAADAHVPPAWHDHLVRCPRYPKWTRPRQPLSPAIGRSNSGKFLDQIDAAVPTDLDVHLILDNYGTHKTPLIHRWLTKHPRFHLHFTPTYASWLNLVERWFAALTNKQLRRGAHRSVTALKRAIREFLDVHNADPKPLVWTKSADDILASIARFAHRTVTAHAR